jgi:hypothetical protein
MAHDKYLMGTIDDMEVNGEMIRVAVDSNGNRVSIGSKASIQLLTFVQGTGPTTALFRQNKTSTYVPPGWRALNRQQYTREFAALKGKPPTEGNF